MSLLRKLRIEAGGRVACGENQSADSFGAKHFKPARLLIRVFVVTGQQKREVSLGENLFNSAHEAGKERILYIRNEYADGAAGPDSQVARGAVGVDTRANEQPQKCACATAR